MPLWHLEPSQFSGMISKPSLTGHTGRIYTSLYGSIVAHYGNRDHVGLHVIASYAAIVVCSPSIAHRYGDVAGKFTHTQLAWHSNSL